MRVSAPGWYLFLSLSSFAYLWHVRSYMVQSSTDIGQLIIMKYLKGLVRHNSLENRPVAVTAGPLVRKPRRFKFKGMIFQKYVKSKTAASFKFHGFHGRKVWNRSNFSFLSYILHLPVLTPPHLNWTTVGLLGCTVLVLIRSYLQDITDLNFGGYDGWPSPGLTSKISPTPILEVMMVGLYHVLFPR